MIGLPRPGFTSFGARIFWSVVPVLAVFLVVEGWVNVRDQRRLVTEEFIKRGEAIAAHLAASTELGVFSEDTQLLGASIRGAVKDPDVAYVIIQREDGTRLADGGRWAAVAAGRASTTLPDRPVHRTVDPPAGSAIEFLSPILSEGTGASEDVLVGRPGRSKSARVIGGVTVGLSLESVERSLRSHVRLWGAITLVFVALSAGVVYGFSRRITRPINRLTEQAQKVAAGRLDQRIPVESRDEIGQLASAFNEMTRALQANIGDKERVLAELQELNQTLEDRIRQRTAELEERSRALALASRHKSDFLANVSHELRTPLNAILGFNEMIIGGLYGDVPPDLKVPLTDIQNSGRHLLRLINDVLDLSKIEAGRMELSADEYAVHDVVETVRASLGSLAAEKGLALVASVPDGLPMAYGDAKRITQCLVNLAGNALKFTREGRVEISVRHEGDQLHYRVSDTGIGIAGEHLDQVFGEFRQADATVAREFGGTGLGLSITKKFVEMHGGQLGVESELGKGSTFFFSIPLRVPGPTAP